MNVMQQKLDYWGPLVGKTVVAKNYRGETATGTLLQCWRGAVGVTVVTRSRLSWMSRTNGVDLIGLLVCVL